VSAKLVSIPSFHKRNYPNLKITLVNDLCHTGLFLTGLYLPDKKQFYMKKILSLLLFTAALFVVKPAQSQTKAKWAEKDAFHKVMSETFHPAEEGKFEPIRQRSLEMVNAAIAWKNSAAPEGFNKDAIKKQLKKLVKDSRELDRKIKKDISDADLKEELTELHDLFHEITEKCTGEDHH
jgi:hypothetical protein